MIQKQKFESASMQWLWWTEGILFWKFSSNLEIRCVSVIVKRVLLSVYFVDSAWCLVCCTLRMDHLRLWRPGICELM